MTSKERVLKAIHHEEPDRVPVGEWGIDHDHVSRIIGHHTYWRNRKDTTLALWEGRRDEVVESLKNDYVELIEKLDYDLITVELVPPKGYCPEDPPKKIAEGVWEDKKGNIYKYAASNDSIMCMNHAAPRETITEEEIADAMHPKIDESQFELIDFISEKYGAHKAILSRDIDIYGVLMAPFGGDQVHQLILPMTAPEEIKKMYAPGLQRNKQIIDHLKEKNVLVAMQGYDFAMNTGTFLPPAVLRQIYFPFMEMVNEEIVQSGMIPFFHCCGKTWDMLDDFIKAGYQGYQSIQESAGMDARRIKAQYGNQITLWTGIQCETLITGSEIDVEYEVRKYLEIMMPGGGFIFGSTNSVQYGADTDNYLRALDIVRREGVYR